MVYVARVVAVAFFVFILWVIYSANTGASNSLIQLSQQYHYGDKIGHFGLFGLLTFMAIIGIQFKCLTIGRFSLYYGVLAVFLFVVGEEISQIFFPTRTFDWVDLSADMAGITLFSLVAHVIRLVASKKSDDRAI